MTVEFHPAAAEEFVESAAFYEREASGLGDTFIAEIERVAAFLQDYPDIGQITASGFRRIVVVQFPYSLIYRASGETIFVVAVAHHHRRPGYWRDRVE